MRTRGDKERREVKTVEKGRKLTRKEREEIYEKGKGHCCYCGTKIEYKDMQVDHMKPLKKGGSDTLKNMLPICRSCRHYKNKNDVEEFRKYLQGIPKKLERDSAQFEVGKRFGLIRETQEQVTFFFEEMEGKEDKRIDRNFTKKQIREWDILHERYGRKKRCF